MFNWIANPYSIALFIAALFAGVMAVFIWQRRQVPGALPLSLLLGGAAFWAAAYGVEIGSPTIESKLLWANIAVVVIPFLPSLAMLTILYYTERDAWITRGTLAALLIPPAISVLMYWTNGWHGWVLENFRLIPVGAVNTLKADNNWFYWVYVGYVYIILLLAAIILIRDYTHGDAENRRYTGALLVGMAIPAVVNIISVFDFLPLPDLDWTPFTFIALGMFAAWGLFHWRMFDPREIDTGMLLDPHTSLQSLREDARRARMLAAISLIVFALLAIPATIRLLTHPQTLTDVLITLAVSAIAYLFSRSRYYKTGIWILLIGLATMPMLAIATRQNLAPDHVFRILIWTFPALALGGLLLPPKQIWILFGLIVFMFWAVSHWLVPLPGQEVFALASLALVLTLLFTAVAWIHTQNFSRIEEITVELARNERFLANVVNSLDNPFYVINVADYSIAMANDAARELGVMDQQTCYALTHQRETPCDGLDHPCPLQRVRTTRQAYTVEHVHYKPDGSSYYAEVHGYPILDDDGNVVQMIEYSLDVTTRREAESELRKLTQAIEQTAAAIVITDERGRIEYVNPSFTEITGYTKEETLGKDTSILKSGEHPAAFYREMWETVQRGDTWHGELVNRRKDGSTYIEEQVITPIRDERGNITNYVAVKQDITARKEAEETIRKLSQAVEQSASTVVITNRDGEIEYANPSFTRVTGYSLEEALGQNPRILKSGKMPPEFYQEMWDTLTAGETWSGEMINKKKNGELYWEFATIAPVKDENGQITHYIAVKDDITARKRMEEELRIARDRALEANRLKGRILANVSHDMRTPLGSILGYADMLQAEVFGPLSEQQRERLQRIMESSNHLLAFVNNLLTQSELESGSLELTKNRIAVHQMANSLIANFEVLAQKKGLTLTSEVDDSMPEVILGDRYWMNRIVSNLVGNAIKFTREGGVTVQIRRVETAFFAIAITDTGDGIPPEDLGVIFEPFRKGSRKVPGSGGAGLGLAIVKDVVKQMGGRITVQSTLNQGSIFTVLLPLETPAEEES